SLVRQMAADKGAIADLKHEYEVAKNLDHESVIHVFEVDITRKVPYLVLELSHGKNLKLILRNRASWIAHHLPEILDPMIDGLAYLHKQGWLHCDVKPDNFLVDEDREVKLIDFSIARRRTRGIGKIFGRFFSKVQGTRSYMAPEQIRGKPLDIQTDIYGLGCTVYELLTTKPPFTGSTPGELLQKHLKSRIPVIHTINKNVTEEFSKLLQEMMAKKSADRPDSMESLKARIKQLRIYNILPKAPEDIEEDEEDNF
ncbi:MAG: serine/threonine-protein kinase, partial [Pirellulaceae bacterium]